MGMEYLLLTVIIQTGLFSACFWRPKRRSCNHCVHRRPVYEDGMITRFKCLLKKCKYGSVPHKR